MVVSPKKRQAEQNPKRRLLKGAFLRGETGGVPEKRAVSQFGVSVDK